MDVARTLDRGLDFFGNAVRQVGEDEWDSPTPCAEWNAREVVGHVIGVMRIAVTMVRGGELSGSLAPTEVTDPVAEWERTAAEVRSEVADVDLDAVRETALGTKPLSFSLTFPTLDLFLHGWDLSRAVGSPVEIPEDVITWIDEFLRHIPEERLRGLRVFGPAQPTPPDADPTTRLMAFAGREVQSY
jgi:uncharacterized protein (TIGR03086 family)